MADEFVGNFSAPIRKPFREKEEKPDIDALRQEMEDMIAAMYSDLMAEVENMFEKLIQNYNLSTGPTYSAGDGISINGNVIASTLDTC